MPLPGGPGGHLWPQELPDRTDDTYATCFWVNGWSAVRCCWRRNGRDNNIFLRRVIINSGVAKMIGFPAKSKVAIIFATPELILDHLKKMWLSRPFRRQQHLTADHPFTQKHLVYLTSARSCTSEGQRCPPGPPGSGTRVRPIPASGMEAVPHAETATRAVMVQNPIAYTKIKPMRFTHDQQS